MSLSYLFEKKGRGLDNIFSMIRETLPISEVVRYYGLDVGRNGMACCPFHDDRNPSMKIYESNYFCFGCGASGDVVGFTARLFSLSHAA